MAQTAATGAGAGEAPSPDVAPTAPAIVVSGDATPEQLAALVAVLSAASGGDDDSAPGDRTSVWAAHAAALRHPVNHGPGAWRTSLRT